MEPIIEIIGSKGSQITHYKKGIENKKVVERASLKYSL